MPISRLAIVVAFSMLWSTASGQSVSAKDEWGRINGEWEVVSTIYSGLPDAKNVGDVVRFADGTVVWFENGKASPKARVALDPTGRPKDIDVSWGPIRGRKVLTHGIYELKEGGALRICATIAHTPEVPERPTEFKSPKGSQVWVWLFSRRAAKAQR